MYRSILEYREVLLRRHINDWVFFSRSKGIGCFLISWEKKRISFWYSLRENQGKMDYFAQKKPNVFGNYPRMHLLQNIVFSIISFEKKKLLIQSFPSRYSKVPTKRTVVPLGERKQINFWSSTIIWCLLKYFLLRGRIGERALFCTSTSLNKRGAHVHIVYEFPSPL